MVSREKFSEAHYEGRYFEVVKSHFLNLIGGREAIVYKPSPQQEAWIGFDQGIVKTTLKTREFFQYLSNKIHHSGDNKNTYLGYFLQYKVLEHHDRSSKHMPHDYRTPYLRAPLSLCPNKTTNISQHETLVRLSELENTSVMYALPMVFTMDDMIKEPKLDELKMIDVRTAPREWITNQPHFICFQNESDSHPIWHSDPVEADLYKHEEWIENVFKQAVKGEEDILGFIKRAIDLVISYAHPKEIEMYSDFERDPVTLLPECMNVLEVISK